MAGVNQGPKAQGTSTKDGRRPPPLDPHGLIGNPVIVAVRGRVGDVVYKTYGARIIITRVPCFDGYVPTAVQRERRDRMREATAYAKRIYADPAAKALYVAAAKTLHRQPFRLAISDYLKGCTRVVAHPPKAGASAGKPRPRVEVGRALRARHFHEATTATRQRPNIAPAIIRKFRRTGTACRSSWKNLTRPSPHERKTRPKENCVTCRHCGLFRSGRRRQ